jgi:hypothetical protein
VIYLTYMAESRAKKKLGKLVALALKGAWRRSPPPLDISAEELELVAPLLLGSGAGALGWWRVRHTDLRHTPAALQLQEAYRLHSLQSALHEAEIKEVVQLLHSAGVTPVLVKGYSVARLYPEKGLRPYGDIDLCIKPEQFLTTESLLRNPAGKKYNVDLHEGFAKLDALSAEELLARSKTIALDEVELQVLGPEDQLRILCTHLLRHSAWRPLWLCDIAAALESLSPDFDWDRFLGADPLVSDWIRCAIGLAHQLLDAEVDQTPAAMRAKNLPSWLVPHVLKNWNRPFPDFYPPLSYTRPLATYLRDPKGLVSTLIMRWPDPIEATIRRRAPFNESSRLPYQLGNLFSRVGKFLISLPRFLREGDR